MAEQRRKAVDTTREAQFSQPFIGPLPQPFIGPLRRNEPREGVDRPGETKIGRVLANSDLNTDNISNTGKSLGQRMAERGQVYYPGAGRATGRIGPNVPVRMSMRDRILESDPNTAIGIEKYGLGQGMLFHPDYLDELEANAAGSPALRDSSKGVMNATMGGSVALAKQELEEAGPRIAAGLASSKKADQKAAVAEETNLRRIGGTIADAKMTTMRHVQDLMRKGVSDSVLESLGVSRDELQLHRHGRELLVQQFDPTVEPTFYPGTSQEQLNELADIEGVHTATARSVTAALSDQRAWRKDIGQGRRRRVVYPNLDAAEVALHKVSNVQREFGGPDAELTDEYLEAADSATAGTKGLNGGLTGQHGRRTAKLLRAETSRGFDRKGIIDYWKRTDKDKQATFALALAAGADRDPDVIRRNKGLARQSAMAMTIDVHQTDALGIKYEDVLGTKPGQNLRAFGMVGHQPGKATQPHYGTIAGLTTSAAQLVASRMAKDPHHKGGWNIAMPDQPDSIRALPNSRDFQENIWGSFAMINALDQAVAKSKGISARQSSRDYYAKMNADVDQRQNTGASMRTTFQRQRVESHAEQLARRINSEAVTQPGGPPFVGLHKHFQSGMITPGMATSQNRYGSTP